MSLEAFLTSALFKRDQACRTIVYPNGVAGRGYIVPDAATERRMRRTMMWAVLGSGAFGGVGMIALRAIYGQISDWTAQPWIIAVTALVIFNFAYRSWAKRLMLGMALAPERMRLVEAWKRQAEAMPRWYLWFNAVAGPILVAGMVFNIAVTQSTMIAALSVICMPLFVIASMQAFYGLRIQASGEA
jgi:hypothetical protein